VKLESNLEREEKNKKMSIRIQSTLPKHNKTEKICNGDFFPKWLVGASRPFILSFAFFPVVSFLASVKIQIQFLRRQQSTKEKARQLRRSARKSYFVS